MQASMGSYPEEDRQGQKVLIIKLLPEDFNWIPLIYLYLQFTWSTLYSSASHTMLELDLNKMAESISISRASSRSIRARDECAKRARGTPTGVTPKQLAKRRLVGSTSKRQLSFSDLSISDSTIARDWSTSEKRVLHRGYWRLVHLHQKHCLHRQNLQNLEHCMILHCFQSLLLCHHISTSKPPKRFHCIHSIVA